MAIALRKRTFFYNHEMWNKRLGTIQIVTQLPFPRSRLRFQLIDFKKPFRSKRLAFFVQTPSVSKSGASRVTSLKLRSWAERAYRVTDGRWGNALKIQRDSAQNFSWELDFVRRRSTICKTNPWAGYAWTSIDPFVALFSLHHGPHQKCATATRVEPGRFPVDLGHRGSRRRLQPRLGSHRGSTATRKLCGFSWPTWGKTIPFFGPPRPLSRWKIAFERCMMALLMTFERAVFNEDFPRGSRRKKTWKMNPRYRNRIEQPLRDGRVF